MQTTEKQTGKRSKFRSLIIGLILLALLMGVTFRLLWIQTVDSSKLTKEAEKIWNNNNPVLKAKRGTIYDRSKNYVMAWEEPAYFFTADPSQLKEKDIDKTATQLSSLLEISKENLTGLLRKKGKYAELRDREAGKIYFSKEVYANYLRLKQKKELKGIYAYKTTQRQYTEAGSAHLLGFLNSEEKPVGGIESTYQNLLHGQDGYVKYKKAANGMMITDGPESYKPPIDGKDLVLTIDASIQSHVEKVLDQAMKQYEAKGATAIVADPSNGEILAMVNRPTFDLRKASSTYDEENGRNIAVQSQFEPGSTFKIVTLAAAIEEGKFEAESTYTSGCIQVSGLNNPICDWKKGGWGDISYREGVIQSSNVGFVKLGERLGAENLYKYIDRFGFGRITDRTGRKTGIDLPGEASGFYFGRELVASELATTAFGQGIAVTPIQQVQAVGSIANGGNLVKPHLLKEVIDPKTKKTVEETAIEKQQIIRPETATQVKQILRDVIKNGTGQKADAPGYRVAGKTGTAQKPDTKSGKYLPNTYITSFIGFAPADNPKVVVYVALDEPKGAEASGGSTAAPIAKDIIQQTMQVLRVPSLGTEPEIK
ncbi:peptidoglycan D,D-transpeptidase FtsI family protein [Baia soyae]|uniref:Stage V sporulation protein D (Sporulation-specific penicillin-binding protein)/penicillin-binding protein 2B n=1 Tax=Baia soyae TaxID=1544746 RepID=A0A4R2S294_9BACL|nr:penicillin-binding transpeptidase domain-containing protein [Baia soyae]TCP70433.1 stage V sporulation protein D (sporulation-specific penicillin-binding protein)/penicillin-binding protein 2B [Baia soyae]